MRGHREVPKNPRVAVHTSRLLPYKQSIAVSSLESTLPGVLILNSLKSFGINTYTKTKGEVQTRSTLCHPLLLKRKHAAPRTCGPARRFSLPGAQRRPNLA